MRADFYEVISPIAGKDGLVVGRAWVDGFIQREGKTYFDGIIDIKQSWFFVEGREEDVGFGVGGGQGVFEGNLFLLVELGMPIVEGDDFRDAGGKGGVDDGHGLGVVFAEDVEVGLEAESVGDFFYESGLFFGL